MIDGPALTLAGLAGIYAALWASEWWALLPAVAAVVLGLLIDDEKV